MTDAYRKGAVMLHNFLGRIPSTEPVVAVQHPLHSTYATAASQIRQDYIRASMLPSILDEAMDGTQQSYGIRRRECAGNDAVLAIPREDGVANDISPFPEYLTLHVRWNDDAKALLFTLTDGQMIWQSILAQPDADAHQTSCGFVNIPYVKLFHYMLEALTNHTANDKSSHSSYNARLPTAFFSLSSDPTNPYQRLSLVYMIKGGLNIAGGLTFRRVGGGEMAFPIIVPFYTGSLGSSSTKSSDNNISNNINTGSTNPSATKSNTGSKARHVSTLSHVLQSIKDGLTHDINQAIQSVHHHHNQSPIDHNLYNETISTHRDSSSRQRNRSTNASSAPSSSPLLTSSSSSTLAPSLYYSFEDLNLPSQIKNAFMVISGKNAITLQHTTHAKGWVYDHHNRSTTTNTTSRGNASSSTTGQGRSRSSRSSSVETKTPQDNNNNKDDLDTSSSSIFNIRWTGRTALALLLSLPYSVWSNPLYFRVNAGEEVTKTHYLIKNTRSSYDDISSDDDSGDNEQKDNDNAILEPWRRALGSSSPSTSASSSSSSSSSFSLLSLSILSSRYLPAVFLPPTPSIVKLANALLISCILDTTTSMCSQQITDGDIVSKTQEYLSQIEALTEEITKLKHSLTQANNKLTTLTSNPSTTPGHKPSSSSHNPHASSPSTSLLPNSINPATHRAEVQQAKERKRAQEHHDMIHHDLRIYDPTTSNIHPINSNNKSNNPNNYSSTPNSLSSNGSLSAPLTQLSQHSPLTQPNNDGTNDNTAYNDSSRSNNNAEEIKARRLTELREKEQHVETLLQRIKRAISTLENSNSGSNNSRNNDGGIGQKRKAYDSVQPGFSHLNPSQRKRTRYGLG